MTNWCVIPVRNGVAMTRDAVADCLAQDIGDTRVWVLNNGSRDGTAEFLNSQDQQRVMVSHHGQDHGVSASWNVALRQLFDVWEAPYALVVNNDVRLRYDTYRRLVEDGGLFVTAVGVNDPRKIELYETGHPLHGSIPAYNFPDPAAKRPHPDFSCYLIRRECWRKVGPFDEAMVHYASDGDYHVRMQQSGIEACCLDLPFLHFACGTIKTADAATAAAIHSRADMDRAAFKMKWGCAIGSPEYYALFPAGTRPEDRVEQIS
jgi:GT2 family glycosyltransferase